jgi:hypothetical protein
MFSGISKEVTLAQPAKQPVLIDFMYGVRLIFSMFAL